MGTKITDLAYLAFKTSDTLYSSLNILFSSREDILKDADS